MVSSEFVKDLVVESVSKIVLLVIDGVGGLPHPETGKTELETADTPNLDELARKGACGMIDLIGRGITPGSGVAHLSLFGYDPIKSSVGRGAIAAMGIGLDMGEDDVAARLNFASMDDEGLICDRRAGRIPTEKNAELCKLLREIKIEGVRIKVEPVKDYRAVVIFEGDGLSPELTDSDPQDIGLAPKAVEALVPAAERTARIANEFISQARKILRDKHPTNMVLMRGFAKRPYFPPMSEIYKLRAGAIATYPDYLGIARMVGMDVLPTGPEIADEIDTLEEKFGQYDFFYLHIKKTDSLGEDGNFDGKVKLIEEVDAFAPRLLKLNPDVIVVTGDHSTPCVLKAHSWHPVPIIVWGKWCRPDSASGFSERECSAGSLGRFPGTEVMALALANARRLEKFGA